jgi:anaerobic magnesium-protoporphyrin IX monomethyl ester cyclase
MKILTIILRMNKDQFVYDQNDSESRYNFITPLGIPYIIAVLKRAGYEVDCLNLNDHNGLIKDVVQTHLAQNKYDVIFTGGVSLFYHNIKDLIQYIREVSDAKIVLGGGLTSARPELMMRLLKPDFVIMFEGEETARELVQYLERGFPLGNVDGICYWDNGNVVQNRQRKPIHDLDSLPYPDLDAIGYDKQLETFKPTYIAYDHTDNPRPYPIVASRGCVFNCTFCFHTIGKGYRQRSIENIMDEIKYAVAKYRANVIFFNDEMVDHDKIRLLEFARQFNEFATTVPWKITMMMNLRVDFVDEEILDAVCGMGCNIVGLGLESYSAIILKKMKKHTTPSQIKKAIELVAERKCVCQGSFIFGDPNETLETAQETLDYYTRNQHVIKKGGVIFFIMLFPGSQLYDDALSRGIIKNEEQFFEKDALATYGRYTPINLTRLSDVDFERLKDRVFTADYITTASSLPILVEDGHVRVVCPYCGNEQDYHNISFPAMVGCRDCNGRFYIAPWYFKLSQWIVQHLGFYRAKRIRNLIP